MGSLLLGDLAQGADGAEATAVAAIQDSAAYLGGLLTVLVLLLAVVYQTSQMASHHHEAQGRRAEAAHWRGRERPAWILIPGLLVMILVLVGERVSRFA